MVCIMTLSALLHGLHVTATLKGDRVTVVSFFDDDTPAAKAQVKVLTTGKDVVAEGQTDEKGEWSFARPAPGKYTVVVDGGDGHRKREALIIPTDAALSAQSSKPGDSEIRVTSGPSRTELTRFPWLRAGLGIGAIGCLGAVLWLAMRRRDNPINLG